ncbi:nmra family transcriptional regulator [Intrasporangium chromatireducens Q5-1]|uniref:Nmra family transcriptional regulator n=1 Tax=Intrasporangium chromatireducens Q5-1 TaxID=584657 RepID=W9GUB4_9MICO|nr:NAD(P)H-binding protein [Intrasporangium chromatireducens]EWT07469.1 nmra family transcriptional regulator [Intrasporangium chromatireducens Q5-1]
MTATVLVIGAAGKTGRAVTRALLERGARVRAAVRPGSTSEPYAAELVSPVTVDLETGLGLERALAGADAVYHLAPNVHPDEVGMARRVADAAGAAGVSRFVFHSVLHPDDDAMPHHVRKGEAERLIRVRLPGATVLRPAAYHQNVLGSALGGRIRVPYSLDAPFTNVDLDDVAEVAARVLTECGHEGRSYDLVGPERYSVRELAAVAADVLGREVVAEQIPLSEWLAGPGGGLGEERTAALLAMFEAYDREGFADESDDLERLLGRRPATWRGVVLRAVT